MSETRTGWLLPVLLAVAISTAAGFAFLYATRPNAGELGEIRVVYGDADGKTPNAVHIIVAEAPLAQRESVTPGNEYAGVINYPIPYLTKPHLRLNCGKRQYTVSNETETGFTWSARPLPEDFRESVTKDKKSDGLESLMLQTLQAAANFRELKPGIIFDDFSWEAKGQRGSARVPTPKSFEQSGSFSTVAGQEAPVYFPVPYETTPNVELTSGYLSTTVVVECTPTHFKWRNIAKAADHNNSGSVKWVAKGIPKMQESK